MTSHIYTITDEKKFKGDWANAVAVGQALAAEITGDDVDLLNLDGDDAVSIDDRLHATSTENDVFIVTAGAEHAEFLANIEGTNIVKVLSAHQLSDTVTAVAGQFNYVALPVHALTADQKAELSAKTNLIETLGVPHLVTQETLDEAYQKRLDTDPRFAEMNENYLNNITGFDLLVLAGDALEASGEVKCFAPEESAKWAHEAMVEARALGGVLMITNGPRTGKFDPETGKETQAHRGDTVMDPVTAAARTSLLSNGYKEDKDFFIWDFRFLDKGVDSAYQALLATAHKTAGTVYMPGESTSMVTEAADILGRKFVIYEAGSMNDTHQAHMRAVNASGLADMWLKSGPFIEAAELAEPVEFITDAQRIARAVLKPAG